MERGNMSKREASILLVDMVSDLRGYGADDQMLSKPMEKEDIRDAVAKAFVHAADKIMDSLYDKPKM